MTTRETRRILQEGLVAKRGTSPFARGEGCWVWDVQDRRYLDMTSAHGVAPLGHCHPQLTRAISEQAARLVSCSAGFLHDQRDGFLESLEAVLPSHFEHVFLCNSGTEAIEAGIKFAYLATGRPGLVALKRDFHGRTLGSLGATWNPRFRKPFAALLHSADFVEPGDLGALEAALTDEVGLLMLEVVQGESGVHAIDDGFLRTAQELCRSAGCLLLIDEIQTGIGRTGRWWAHQAAGLEPDLMALAKGIAGGFPMGALVSTATVAANLKPGLHGSTFGGAPLACAAAQATLETIVRDDLIEQGRARGAYLLERLEAELAGLVLVKDIRGRGLMLGIELRKRAAPFLGLLMEEHSVLALPAGPTVIRFLPPLIVSEEQIDLAVEALRTVLSES